ncbi:helix-turn-helix transcriptional regulator [Ciceribacter naphthalenivorans]|uniref:Helix-turn-helix transcriptional regulator n=2 Tax=Alphaproteobacteria TaxID=28211 RepID=A0A512HKZ1_9HYPH|nr:helix-turn-helix transcriptional regulator [Ciceribacter naphthalenivorans]GEO86117.1 helix-turn-helix transcriptional regulator [Ciceribacter naphthalenivorans]GLR22684.1 helix-turn-helix transcriptional regulator [Ciceribacter naphthalenivorans]GLT05540.1 helix-turn-helix transcriptional regulator [Sphingomonas psychrolutea]
MDKEFSAWNEAIAEAIGAVGTNDFAPRIEAALRSIVDFDILMAFAYSGAEKPVCFYHNMNPERMRTVVDAYVSGPYLLDPFYGAATGPQIDGVLRLRDLAPDQFHNSEYYRRHYVLTGIRDEVGIVCRPAGWTGVVISFTRPVAAPAFGRRDLAAIRAAEPVIQTLAKRHWRHRASPATPAGWDTGTPPDPISETLSRMTDGILTPREIEITSLVLRGHSSGSISRHLSIAEGTVKIHRKNIYQKLDISSQSELFAMFILQLSGQ